MKCIKCNSEHIRKDGEYKGYQRYRCLDCKKSFNYGEYGKKIEYITHFNTKIRKTNNNKLTRENYCIPTNKISYVCKKSLKFAIERMDYKIPNEYYIDENTYTEKYVKEHYDECMYNYDLNIKYFYNLKHKEFDEYLKSFVSKNKFKEISGLEEVNHIEGIYILVLDEYNQVYIGISNDIKKRILAHWGDKKDFDRLLFGKKDNSVLSIDSFGALDTTRIFFKEVKHQSINNQEYRMVEKFKSEYSLNRVNGGINSEDDKNIRDLELIGSMKKRKFK